MLLVVDVGNTQTHFGAFRERELLEHWRFATVRQSTADQLGAALRNPELVGGGLADGCETPVLEQLLLAERAEVGLGVADVDDEQHRWALCSAPR